MRVVRLRGSTKCLGWVLFSRVGEKFYYSAKPRNWEGFPKICIQINKIGKFEFQTKCIFWKIFIFCASCGEKWEWLFIHKCYNGEVGEGERSPVPNAGENFTLKFFKSIFNEFFQNFYSGTLRKPHKEKIYSLKSYQILLMSEYF